MPGSDCRRALGGEELLEPEEHEQLIFHVLELLGLDNLVVLVGVRLSRLSTR